MEVTMALIVLSTAAAGTAGLFTIAVSSARAARAQTTAAWLAMDKLEQLRSLRWAFDASGLPMTDTSSDVSVEPVTGGGGGLSPSPPDALRRSLPGHADYLDAAGRWVGGGAETPREAVYLRRWSIQPLPDDPVNTVILQVLVAPVAGPRARPEAASAARVPGDVLVVSIKTRKGL